MKSQIHTTVSGSFRRHMPQVKAAVHGLTELGAVVLSPSAPEVVDAIEDFVFVASDLHRSPRLVQDRHLAAIADSDFLWLECPDGYVGPSAALELGFAAARGVPIYASRLPSDLTMRQYVMEVTSYRAAIVATQEARKRTRNTVSMLLDPVIATDEICKAAGSMRALLTVASGKRASESLKTRLGQSSRRIRELASLAP